MPATPARHSPTRFDIYLETHEGHMEQLRSSGFVGPDTLSFDEVGGASGILLTGEVACKGRIVVSVEKFLVVLEGRGAAAMVQTEMYSYNVFVRGGHNIFRYDNQHPERLYPGHSDPHHKHEFDPKTGEQLPNSPRWTGAQGWPTLADVVREAERWYWDNHRGLQASDEYPDLGLRN